MSTEEEKNIKYTELENMLLSANDCDLPAYSIERGEKSYRERYMDIKKVLMPIHASVEKGALSNSVMECVRSIKETMLEEEREKELKKIPITYLNNHGCGHVERVMERVFGMLCLFGKDVLSPYELFILLCAIQLHDVGNIFGREKHEKTLQKISQEKCSPYIPDGPERKLIEKIAATHGGTYNENKDTISLLPLERTMKEHKVRCRLLAALLRFGDEIADDSTRADREGLELGIIPDESLLFHHFSTALHTVKIEKDDVNLGIYLHLFFEFDSEIAIKKFDKFGRQVYLLDEIYDRTKKTEQERRYCTRFLRPYFFIEKIKVEISINDKNDIFHVQEINYELEEKGYPDVDICMDSAMSGEELSKMFSKKEGELNE